MAREVRAMQDELERVLAQIEAILLQQGIDAQTTTDLMSRFRAQLQGKHFDPDELNAAAAKLEEWARRQEGGGDGG